MQVRGLQRVEGVTFYFSYLIGFQFLLSPTAFWVSPEEMVARELGQWMKITRRG